MNHKSSATTKQIRKTLEETSKSFQSNEFKSLSEFVSSQFFTQLFPFSNYICDTRLQRDILNELLSMHLSDCKMMHRVKSGTELQVIKMSANDMAKRCHASSSACHRHLEALSDSGFVNRVKMTRWKQADSSNWYKNSTYGYMIDESSLYSEIVNRVSKYINGTESAFARRRAEKGLDEFTCLFGHLDPEFNEATVLQKLETVNLNDYQADIGSLWLGQGDKIWFTPAGRSYRNVESAKAKIRASKPSVSSELALFAMEACVEMSDSENGSCKGYSAYTSPWLAKHLKACQVAAIGRYIKITGQHITKAFVDSLVKWGDQFEARMDKQATIHKMVSWFNANPNSLPPWLVA